MEEFADRIEALSESLIAKLERAVEELDCYVIKSSRREKTIEYDDDGKKPLYEELVEKEEIEIKKGVIDRSGLKQLISALNELKGEEGDRDQEGIAVFLSEDSEELSG